MRTSRKDMASVGEMAGAVMRNADWDDMTTSMDNLPRGFDFEIGLKGLPNDACQCHHWGFLTSGRLRVHYTNGTDEIVNAGEAFYMHPGHVPHVEEAVEWVLFTPKEEMKKTMEAIMQNMKAHQKAA